MRAGISIGLMLLCGSACCGAQQLREVQGKDSATIEFVTANIVRVHIAPGGRSGERTLVLDPALAQMPPAKAALSGQTLSSAKMQVDVRDGGQTVQIADANGKVLLTVVEMLSQSHGGNLVMVHDENEELYGMRGLDRTDTGAGILRTGGATIAGGIQGDGGAPFFFTRHYGVLVDSDGGVFEPRDERLRFRHGSRPDLEFFIIAGAPMEVMDGLSLLTGRPPMPPKWTLGFLNSQWGATESEVLDVVGTYRRKQIPVSGFILDFDWKAWGEDNYGEWRWNSTSGEGNAAPDKFPDGASGKFAADLLAQQVHLAGILKPRILIDRSDGKPTEASAYATAHNFWYPGEHRDTDYYTHRLAGNLDFNNAEMRAWFWQHLVPAFQAGITAWWSDEADYSNKDVFNNFQFMNMGRALYDGQRAMSPERVWSINRAYYLGAGRYGYALWSGDISTGFQSMAYQRRRMIAAMNLGEPLWSMDTGGFDGHPTPENYARWMEFAAFVPIDRVHGNFNEKRQPWVYGPVAEAAATRALRLRYALIPYLYANQRHATETGVGVVRPLFWAFPDDPRTADETRAWMFGDALLVSPIVEHGATTHSLYLPEGQWFDYASGKPMAGGRELQVAADAVTWQDIPIFVRAGSIVATQDAGADALDARTITLDVFPFAGREAAFTAYDDDGHTYAYEHGDYRRQQITATLRDGSVTMVFAPATGSYTSRTSDYLVRLHRGATKVGMDGNALHQFKNEAELSASSQAGWTHAQDRFGAVTLLRLPMNPVGAKGATLDVR